MACTCIGIDTSCYTTSCACVSNESIVFEQRTMLSVALGERGLRQSDAVFQHVRNLPELVESMFLSVERKDIAAVAVSAKPVADPSSYMPVFLAGRMSAVALASALGVPLIETTHQAGHIRAALYQNEILLERDKILALHLSGGTTDVLSVGIEDRTVRKIDRVGGSADLHAGQFVDRVGVRLGLPFPSGKQLEILAREAVRRDIKLPSSVRGLDCSFSGQETKAQQLIEKGEAREEIAYAVYDCLARSIGKLIDSARKEAGELPILLVGGVSGSRLLRELLTKRTNAELFFAADGLSRDNAVGTAFLGMDRLH